MTLPKTITQTRAAAPAAGLPALQASLPTATPAALQFARTLHGLVGQSMARSAGNGAATAALLPMAATRLDTWHDLMAIQRAVLQRLQQQQQGWLQGWAEWAQQLALLKRANTMSEHAEQQYNLMAQAGDLLKTQATDLLSLQENIEVDYGYWVAQKLRSAGAASRT
ncbi:MAG TPA: hypothetical protein VLJ58_20515 [Ramlibacter sp.]|nr:hypothetical protein [Ramlibacter sp.]